MYFPLEKQHYVAFHPLGILRHHIISTHFVTAFFKTFQKYLTYALLGLFIPLLQFLYLANVILGLFISLLQFFWQNRQKIALM